MRSATNGKMLRGLALLLALAGSAEQLCALVATHAGTNAETTAVMLQDPAAAMRRGFDWLQAHQKTSGGWSDENYPGLSALGLWALTADASASATATCARAAAFVAGFAQPDGSIYKVANGGRGTGGLAVYNTAICMTALHAYDRQRYASVILKARAFLTGCQFPGGRDPSAGGFGYEKAGSGPRSRADLSNTGWALMAMRVTQDVEDQRPAAEKRADVDWSAATGFAARLQNQDVTDSQNIGGFGYESGGDRGGIATNRPGAITLRGFGSMTYAGLESMLYAQVGRDDPRVRSAIAWATRHWTVAENPGMGSKGLFYYYAVMAKTLALMGSGDLTAGDRTIAWRRDLTRRLLEIQNADGSWVNADNAFWENDPELVTAYALLALERCAEQ